MLRSAWGLSMQNGPSILGGPNAGIGVNVPSHAPPACAGVKVQGGLGDVPRNTTMLIIRGFWFSPSKLLLAAQVIQTKTLHWKKYQGLSSAHNHHLCPPSLLGFGGCTPRHSLEGRTSGDEHPELECRELLR